MTSKTLFDQEPVRPKTTTTYDIAFQKELERLNDAQRKAVDHIEGPVMVIAGPGTGKTQIIAARIGQILSNPDAQAQPHNVLCLTYTDAGTIAMRQRLLQFIGPTAYHVHIYTFHAFCNEVIQNNLDYFGKRDMEPISELENIEILQQMIDDLPVKHPLKRLKGDMYYDAGRMNNLFRKMKEEDWTPETISAAIQEYSDDLPNREEYVYKRANKKKGIAPGDPNINKIKKETEKLELLKAAADLFPQYQEMMYERGRYDYSDMILWVLKAFREDEDLLRQYQEQYHYFLVDEYQDTNGAQNDILQQLINFWDIPNVFVVGDDDQSIYEFQGARVKNILDFYKKYQDHIEVVILKENYRSSQHILDTSKALIEQNNNRLIRYLEGLDKDLKAKHSEYADLPVKPEIIEYPNIANEEAALVKEIEQLHMEGFPLNEIAVIYYRHRQSENIIAALEKQNIPLQVRKQVNILEHPLINQFINILQYIQDEFERPHSGEHLLFRIMHYPFLNISSLDIARLSSHLNKNRKVRWREVLNSGSELKKLNLDSARSLAALGQDIDYWIKSVPNLTLQSFAEKIINNSGFLKYVMEHEEKEWLMQVITTFFDFIKNERQKNPQLDIKKFIHMVEQMNKNRITLPLNKIIQQENGVHFTTCHSSKGLEFRKVFVIGCTSNVWDNKQRNRFNYSLPDTLTYTTEENEKEASRRLLYVAMTRAKENLFISYSAKDSKGKEQEKSKLLAEITDAAEIFVSNKKMEDAQLTEMGFQLLIEKKIEYKDIPDKDFLNAVLEDYRMSVTDLNKYLSCPVAFYYDNILRSPRAKEPSMAFGNAVHQSLKDLFDKMNKDQNKKFPPSDHFIKGFKKHLERERAAFTPVEFENRLALADELLPAYYNKYINSWNKIAVVEYYVNNIEVKGVPIKGIIDKIEFDGKDVNVVDYKTGKVENGKKKMKLPSEQDPLGGDYWRQLVFYKLMLDNYKVKKWNVISGEIDFIEPEKYGDKDFVKLKKIITPEDTEIVTEQVLDAYDKILSHKFSEGCGEDWCRWCRFVSNEY